MALREYQERAISEIKNQFVSGHQRVLLWMATGAGKTVIFCEMTKGARSRHKSTLIVVRGRKLVDQASQRLWREKTEHGVLMAKHWNYRPTLPTQVASIDTLLARGLRPRADLIILDEAHLATSAGYREFLEHYKDAFVVGCTATPYSPGGLGHIATTVVHPVSMLDLISAGHLVGFRYYAPSEPNMNGVKISSSTKDYVSSETEERMVAGKITGSIIGHWKKIAQGRPTICFAVNIHHSKLIVEEMNANGIRAEHCDADTPDNEREAVIKRLQVGETEIVSNVGIFCTGVDIPEVSCIIVARPTKSYNLYIQQAGRGTRPSPGKSDCIYLDHAGNIRAHGFPTDEPEVDLSTGEKEDNGEKTKTCNNCFAAFRGNQCPYCDSEVSDGEGHAKEVEVEDGELREIIVTAKDPVEQWFEYLTQQRRESGKKQAWIYHQMLRKFPIEKCSKFIPAWFKNSTREKPAFSDSPFHGWSGA